MGTGTLVHSLGSMNLSPMILEITSNPPNRPIWFVDDPLWFADTSFCISNTQQLLKITSISTLFPQKPCTIQINALPLHHKNPPSLSTMLKSAGRFIFIPRVMGTGTLVHSLGAMNLSPMIQISRRSSHSDATFFLWVISRMVVDGRAAKRRLNNSRSVSSSRAELISSSKKTVPRCQ